MSEEQAGEQGGKAAWLKPVALGLGVFLAVMAISQYYTIGARRLEGLRNQEANNLKQMGFALLMYSGDWEGRFPPDLDTFRRVKSSYSSEKIVWTSPGRRLYPGREDAAGGTDDYTYFGAGLTEDAGPDTVLACSRYPKLLGGWVSFLFVDGHVEGYPGTDPAAIAAEHDWPLPEYPRVTPESAD